MKPQPEIIDLTECPPSPEIIVIDSSDDGDADALLVSANVEQVTKTSPKRGKKPKSKNASHTPPDDGSDLFFVDLIPIPLPKPPESVIREDDVHESSQEAPTKLLLPAHVSVVGSGAGVPVEILPPPGPDEDRSYVEYIDYDDSETRGIVRYFDENAETSKSTIFVCKRCGNEGHKTSDCPVQICLTCGARNEHVTRSCPISKTCFNCGMKGHVSKSCPNRYVGGGAAPVNYDDCDRCGSTIHRSNECPTLWRLYDYHTDDERQITLQRRQDRHSLGLGNGGEGYIAEDEWCYNCGNCGHWGDNCDVKPVASYVPQEPSAFGAYNMMSGPFFDPDVETTTTTSRRRSLRDWEENDIPESWGVDAPTNVGKQGKKKDKVRMGKKAREQEEYDDDSWFDKARRSDRSEAKRGRSGRDDRVASPKKLSFGSSVKWAGRSAPPLPTSQPPKATLLERLGGSSDHSRVPTEPRDFSRKTSYHKSPASRPHRKREGDREAERERNRDRDRDRSRRERDLPGPRYTGGYSR